jgi:hypothetical protein
VNDKQQTANTKHQTPNTKHQTANGKQQTANSKEVYLPVETRAHSLRISKEKSS